MIIEDPLRSYNFYVYVANIPLGFQKISTIEETLETETVSEGGCSYAHVLPAPPKQVNKMTFTKGAGTFIDAIFPFKVGYYVPGAIHIFVIEDKLIEDKPEKVIRKHYYIPEALVTKWSVSEFDAQNSSALIETFEIQYSILVPDFSLGNSSH